MSRYFNIKQTQEGAIFLRTLFEWQKASKVPQKQIFISYAWEIDKTHNTQLQQRLQGLHDDLQTAGFNVFFDLADMQGNFNETMQHYLENSHIIIPVCTPRFFDRVQDQKTNVAFEFRLTLEKLQSDPNSVFPIILDGEIENAIPPALKSFPVRDMRDKHGYLFHLLTISEQAIGLLPKLCQVTLHDYHPYIEALSRFHLATLNHLPDTHSRFIGREDYLRQMHQGFSTSHHQILVGLRGIGKSALILAYAHQHRQEYDFVRWVPSKNIDVLNQTFLELASLLGISHCEQSSSQLAHQVYTMTEKHRGLWLFDDADHSLIPYLPQMPSQHALITSRHDLPQSRTLTVFTQEEANRFLIEYLRSDFDTQAAQKLSLLTGCLPLALKQAITYLRDMQISLSAYTALLENQEMTLTTEDNATNTDHAAVLAALDQIQVNREMIGLLSISGGKPFLERLKEHYKFKKNIFISYMRDSIHHDWLEEQIKTLSNDLSAAGMIIRQHPQPLTSLTGSLLLGSDFVIVICIPEMIDCINDNDHPLREEFNHILTKAKSDAKSIIPLCLSGGFTSLPHELASYMAYDISNPTLYTKLLTGPEAPKGILPIIFGANEDDRGYMDALSQFHCTKLTELPPKNPNFTGRQTILENLWQHFASLRSYQPKILALQGITGSGKSQIALHFAHQHFERGDYQMVCWIQADTSETRLRSFLTMAEHLGINTDNHDLALLISQIHQRIAEWDYLLVFDNAEKQKTIKTFLPTANTRHRQHILVTTRNEQWPHKITTPMFTPEESLIFLEKILPNTMKQERQALAKLLELLPLALKYAVAYIQQHQITITHYIELYNEQGTEFLANIQSQKNTHQTIAMTWKMSLEKVEQRSLLAKNILLECALLYPENQPLVLIKHLPSTDTIRHTEMLKAIKTLRSYSLLESTGEDQVKMHPLLQKTLNQHQLSLAPKEHMNKLFGIIDRVTAMLNEIQTPQKHAATCVSLIPHAHQLIDNIDNFSRLCGHEQLDNDWTLPGNDLAFTPPPAIRLAAMMYALANVLPIVRGDTVGKKDLLERTLKIQEAYYGHHHPQIATSMANLAMTLADLQQFDRALPLIQRAHCIFSDQGLLEKQTSFIMMTEIQNKQRQGKSDSSQAISNRCLFWSSAKVAPGPTSQHHLSDTENPAGKTCRMS